MAGSILWVKKEKRRVFGPGLFLGLLAAFWLALPVQGAGSMPPVADPYTVIAERAVFDMGSCEEGYYKLQELYAEYEQSGSREKQTFTDYVKAQDWYRVISDSMPVTLKGVASWKEACEADVTRLVKIWKTKEAHPRLGDGYVNDIALRQIAGEKSGRAGMSGRLTIPDLGISVAMFDCSVKDSRTNQAYTDAQDSAACIRDYGPRTVIADHVFQTFSVLHKAVPGETIAYINDGTAIHRYLYTQGERGINRRTYICTLDGKPVTGGKAGELMLYTCSVSYIDASDIYYTVWLPLD